MTFLFVSIPVFLSMLNSAVDISARSALSSLLLSVLNCPGYRLRLRPLVSCFWILLPLRLSRLLATSLFAVIGINFTIKERPIEFSPFLELCISLRLREIEREMFWWRLRC